jgi:hypothetical protein
VDLGLTKGDAVVRRQFRWLRAAEVVSTAKSARSPGDGAASSLHTSDLNLLVKAGLLEAREPENDYRLLRRPADIPIWMVEAGGDLRPTRCTLRGGPCRWQQMCAVHPALNEAYESLAAVLRSRSLASILEVDEQLAAQGSATAGSLIVRGVV